ncbi:hypothetical protein HYY74_03020 [Candidatus Woesearchaeota archaeon]|nr:hypothetical protein [Candidatus Woesearchaeota archaeon]
MDLGKILVSYITPGAILSMVLGGAGYIVYEVSSAYWRISNNLSPSAVLFSGSFGFSASANPSIYNDDVNGDGFYESVLSFKNPETGGLERFLLERDGQGRLALRSFEVADGKILYRD